MFLKNPVRTLADTEGKLPWNLTNASSLNVIVPPGKFAQGYQMRRCRIIACIHSCTRRYDGMETKTCVIMGQFMTHSTMQQKGLKVYISFTYTHPYISWPQSSFGQQSWLWCSKDWWNVACAPHRDILYACISPATHKSQPRKAKRRLEEQCVGTSCQQRKHSNLLERETVVVKQWS